jgi:hypothetical protein
MVAGYEDGTLELLATPFGVSAARSPRPAASPRLLADTPIAPVVSLLSGPRSILIAGFANGQLGFWSLRSARRLRAVKLHGPIEYLRLLDHHLYVATDLGDFRTFDLDVFYRDYNSFLQAVRKSAPLSGPSSASVSQ